MNKKQIEKILKKHFVPFFMAIFRESLRRDKPFIKLTEKINAKLEN